LIKFRSCLSLASLALAVVYPVLVNGGFRPNSQAVFIALAGLALIVAVSVDQPSVLQAARSPVVITLGLLAGLSVLSAAWTVGIASEALRSGLVIAGYGSVAICAFVCSTHAGPRPIIIGVALITAAECAIGLNALIQHQLPDAQNIYGIWRPGGTFQYPPALALLAAACVPIAAWLIAHRRPIWMFGGAILASLIIATLYLSNDRLAPLLAVAELSAIAAFAYGKAKRRPERKRSIGQWILAAMVTLGAAALLATRHSSNLLHGRASEWSAAVHTWLAHPIIGSGAGSYYIASFHHQSGNPTLFAHELPLELAATLGIPGFLLALALYVTCIRTTFSVRHQPSSLVLGAFTVCFLISNLVDFSWHIAGLGAIWAAATGVMIERSRRSTPRATVT
jgi:O-antigen ligase